jgi:hypothetical protein
MFIPIFIYRDRKSDKEIEEEIKREAAWHKLIEEDEMKKNERDAREKKMAEEKKARESAKIEMEYLEDRKKNPWDYHFLPEGWSIFGQRYITPLDEPL